MQDKRRINFEFHNERLELNRFDIIALDKLGGDLFRRQSFYADNVVWFDCLGLFKLNTSDMFCILQNDNEPSKFYQFDFINDLFDLLDDELNVIETGINLLDI